MSCELSAPARRPGRTADADGRLNIEVRAFQDLLQLPPAELIFAGYSLPFVHPDRWSDEYRRIHELFGEALKVRRVD